MSCGPQAADGKGAGFTQTCQHVAGAHDKNETFGESATTGARQRNAIGYSMHTRWFTEGTHTPRR